MPITKKVIHYFRESFQEWKDYDPFGRSKVLPDAEIEWRSVWVGALITALLFTLGKFLLGFYFGHATPSSTFGAAGSIVLLLLWAYYSSLILLFGAKFTQVYARSKGHKIVPSGFARFNSFYRLKL